MKTQKRNKGFSLVEATVSMLLTLIVGVSVIGGMVFTRQSMELDKQRMAALNYARQALEAAHTNASIDAGGENLGPLQCPRSGN